MTITPAHHPSTQLNTYTPCCSHWVSNYQTHFLEIKWDIYLSVCNLSKLEKCFIFSHHGLIYSAHNIFFKKKSKCIRVIQILILSILLWFIYVHKLMNGTAINGDLIYVYILFYLLFTQYGYSNFKTEKVTKQYNHLSPQKQAKPLTKFYPISIFSPISNQAHKIIIFPIP